jgi:hypothetical protein
MQSPCPFLAATGADSSGVTGDSNTPVCEADIRNVRPTSLEHLPETLVLWKLLGKRSSTEARRSGV